MQTLLSLVAVFSCRLVSALTSQNSFTALHELHTATNGNAWNYPRGSVVWNFSSTSADPCSQSWSGITCDQPKTTCMTSTCEVTKISLPNYNLFGELPSSLMLLSSLNYFKVEKNSLYGTIPWEYFYSLTTLSFLFLNENNFQGSLPNDLQKLAHVNLLKLRENNLVGSIPDSFGEISNLGEVHLSLNSITGSLPSSISKLTKLYYFSVRANQVTGTLPSFFGDLSELQQFSTYDNKFVGTIPPELGNLRNLEFFVAHTNQLKGTLPASLGNITSLKVISLASNRLVGSLPSSLCQLNNLFELEVSDNLLTSTLPSCVTSLTSLEALYLHHNKLRGSLPLDLGTGLQKLLNLDLSFNKLTGSIPPSLAALPVVSSIVLQDNYFSGNLNFITNKSLPTCTFFDVAANVLTGSLPENLFRLPKMQYLLLSSNCFTGSLPESICEGKKIQTLSMNALASGGGCNVLRLLKSYFPSKGFGGQVPACVWNMPALETLYLSGNMLTGDVHRIDIPDSSLLNVVSLSGNTIAGSLPTSFQTRRFSHLDVSWNKISGTLDEMEMHDRASKDKDEEEEEDEGEDEAGPLTGLINLEVNYISGVLPHRILTGTDVRVLDGNLFECSDGSFQPPDLPPHDKASEGYACGSSHLDVSMLLYFLVFMLSVAISARLVYDIKVESSSWLLQELKRFFGNQSDYLLISDLNPSPALAGYTRQLHQLLKTMCILAIMVVFVSVISIPALRGSVRELSTARHLYSWYLSFMYFQGLSPGLVYLAVWACSMMFFAVSTATMTVRARHEGPELDKKSLIAASVQESNIELTDVVDDRNDTTCTNTRSTSADGRLSFSESVLLSLSDSKNTLDKNASFIVRTCVVMIFNFACVLAINIYYVTIIKSEDVNQRIKALVQVVVSMYMCFWNSIAVGFLVYRLKPGIPTEILLRSLFRIINTILMPIVAVLLSSSKCFSAFIFGLDDITNVVLYETCTLQTFSNGVITCVEYDLASIEDTMQRPFVYNGGCTDAIMSDYIPVHIYSYAFDFILMPVVYLVSTTWLGKFEKYIVLPKVMWLDTKVEMRELLRAGNLFGVFFGHFALATTFGLTSPVLMVVITLAFMQDLVIYIYYLRKYIKFSDRCKLPGDPFGGLEAASAAVPSTFRAIILIIFNSSAVFNAFLVLDKVWYEDYGSQGLARKCWTLIVPIVFVALLPFVQDRYCAYWRGRAKSGGGGGGLGASSSS